MAAAGPASAASAEPEPAALPQPVASPEAAPEAEPAATSEAAPEAASAASPVAAPEHEPGTEAERAPEAERVPAAGRRKRPSGGVAVVAGGLLQDLEERLRRDLAPVEERVRPGEELRGLTGSGDEADDQLVIVLPARPRQGEPDDC